MKTKKAIAEIICFLLMLNFFFEGIYKIAFLKQYGFWLARQPIIRTIEIWIKYLVPIIEIAVSLLIIIPSKRLIALWSIIIIEVMFIGWVVSGYLFTGYLFWPYKALWDKPTWMEKMSFGFLLSWLALTAIMLSSNRIQFNKRKQKLESKEPANAI